MEIVGIDPRNIRKNTRKFKICNMIGIGSLRGKNFEIMHNKAELCIGILYDLVYVLVILGGM